MKIFRSHRSGAAFTLIELLVVISIIAILATMGLAGMQGALEAAKKARAKNDLVQITGAVQLYYTEYGRYPIDSAITTDAAAVYGGSKDAGISGPSKENEEVFNVLRGLNAREIKFLEVANSKDATKPTSGIKGGAGTGAGNWYDPWGFEYVIFIDADYGGNIAWAACYNTIGSDASGVASVSVGSACIGFANVKKKLTAPHPFDRTVDLISWQ